MGRRSIKENKSVYQMIREDLGLTREKAGDLIDGMSAEKIEKIAQSVSTGFRRLN